MKNTRQNPNTHLTLKTLAETTLSLQNPESIQDVADIPNVEKTEEGSEGKQQNLKM